MENESVYMMQSEITMLRSENELLHYTLSKREKELVEANKKLSEVLKEISIMSRLLEQSSIKLRSISETVTE